MSKTDYEKLEKSAPKDWQEVKLGEVVSVLGDGLHGTPNYSNDGGYYFINGNNIRNGKIIIKKDTKTTFIEEYKKYKKNLNERTILISINGTLGNVALYKNEKCFLGKSICYFNVLNTINTLFIKYIVINQDFQRYINNFANGTTIKNVSLKTMREYQFLLPPLPEQKAIAEVLSSLDDKIDLLQKQNQTLENIAQTLFRKYFIQDKKKDWEEMKLGQFFPIVTGKKNANHSTTNGKYPFFTCSQNTLKSPNYSFNGKAILLTGNGDFNVKRYEGKFEAYQRTYVLIPYKEKYFGFLFTLIKSFLTQITGGAQGSVIRFITHGMIADFKFLFPKTNIDKKLEQINNIYTKVDSNDKQIQTLEKLRNSLLPKLISGKIRINF